MSPEPMSPEPMSPEPMPPESRSRPLRWPWVLVLLLCSMGLVVAIKLALIHVHAHLDPDQKSFCAISEHVNCDTVARSRYSVFLGVPVAVWGIYGYLVMGAVGVAGWRTRGASPSLAGMAVLTSFSVTVSLMLGAISWLRIASICILCLATYGINAVLFATILVLVRRRGWAATFREGFSYAVEHRGNLGSVAALLGLLTVGSVTGYPRYWERPAQAAAGLASVSASGSAGGSAVHLATGVTEQGQPWIGAEQPRLTIVEFSDYQCPFCNEAHAGMRRLLQTHADIRLVHRHFPLDHQCNPIIPEPFHPLACAYSGLAACAGEQGKFWRANDYLFSHGREPNPIQPDVFAKALGLDHAELQACLQSRAWVMVRPDIDEGVRLNITGTPTFEIGGRLYLGKIPPEVLLGDAGAPGSVRGR